MRSPTAISDSEIRRGFTLMMRFFCMRHSQNVWLKTLAIFIYNLREIYYLILGSASLRKRAPTRLVPIPSHVLRDIALTTDALRLIEKVAAVARRGFRVLINGNCDSLDVLVAPSLPDREVTSLVEHSEKHGRVGLVLEVFHHFRPPSTRGGLRRAARTRSRSVQRSSIVSSIRWSRASAEVVEIPA